MHTHPTARGTARHFGDQVMTCRAGDLLAGPGSWHSMRHGKHLEVQELRVLVRISLSLALPRGAKDSERLLWPPSSSGAVFLREGQSEVLKAVAFRKQTQPECPHRRCVSAHLGKASGRSWGCTRSSPWTVRLGLWEILSG